MIPDGPELAGLEEHLLSCGVCVDRAEGAARYLRGHNPRSVNPRKLDLNMKPMTGWA